MQLKKIAAVCAMAFAAVGSASAALTAGQQAVLNDANSNGRVIFISGASAVQSGFTSIIDKTFVTGSTIRFANTTGSSKDYEAVAGTLAAGTGAWAGQNAIIVYRVKGGSVFGVNPVARAESIESLNVTAGTCGSSGSGTSASPYVCSLGTATPDAGVSDVAPALFQGPINTEGEVAAESLNEEELALLAPTPIYGLGFGVPVTSNLSTSVVLNKAVVSAIMAGNVGNWSQVDSNESGDIVICRRVPGSGTQAVENLYFGGFPCAATFNVPADRDASGAWDASATFSGVTTTVGTPVTVSGTGKFVAANGAGGLIVIENSTSGDVRNCLTAAKNGGTYATKNRDGQNVLVDFGTGGYKAIGVLSMDSLSSSTTSSAWQFRSLDGAGTMTWAGGNNAVVTNGSGKFPTKASITNGTWDLIGMVSFNVPSRTTGEKAEVLAKFLENAQSPDVLASVTNLKNVAGSPAGTADANGTGNVLRASFPGGNQCAPYNRNN